MTTSGASGFVPDIWEAIPLGQAAIKRAGKDITIATIGVDVHRAIEAASKLDQEEISCTVIDLRSIAPLDSKTVCDSVAKTGRLLVVDEDYIGFGLSGELSAQVLEANIPVKFARICTETTIPYARNLEDEVLPNVSRIYNAARRLME